MTGVTIVIIVVVLIVLAFAAASVHILKQYERAVKFRLGRVGDEACGPGLILIIPLVDRIRRVSLRVIRGSVTVGNRERANRAVPS